MTKSLAFIGTQGEAPGEGIHAVCLDEDTGALEHLGVVAEEERPTYVLADPLRAVLYAVSEVGNRDDRFGAIMNYRIVDAQGTLRPLSRRRTGGGPTHLTLDTAGNMLFCANFGGPEAVAIPVNADGGLGPISSVKETTGTGPHRRQTKPHPHGVTIDPTGRFLLVPDMGADRVFVYHINDADLEPAEPPYTALPAGCGPRFVEFGKDGTFAYMVAELSAEIYRLGWDSDSAALTVLEKTKLDMPDSPHQPGAAAFGISDDGRFLYVSNRGTHEMQVFAIDPDNGGLTEIQRRPAGGERPWGLGISHSGKWMIVANQGTDNINVFSVDIESGLLTDTGHALKVGKPTSAAFISNTNMVKLA